MAALLLLAMAAASAADADLVVTARRIDEPVASVPQSVTEIAGDRLRDVNARDIRDLPQLVPTLQLPTAGWRGSTSYALRGQTSGSYAFGTPAVQVYLDDVPLIQGAGVRQLLDLSRIEVLRGPQGTLFGRASNGGAIRLVTITPVPAPAATLTARLGSLGERTLDAAATVPLSETLSARASGQLVRRDGFTDLVGRPGALDGKHEDALRLQLAWTPSERVTASLLYDGARVRQSAGSALLYRRPHACAVGAGGVEGLADCAFGPGYALLTKGQASYADLVAARPEFATFPGGLADAWAAQQTLGRRRVIAGAPGLERGDREDFDLASARISVDIGGVMLRNIFAWQRYRNATAVDQDGTIFPILDNVPSPSPGGRQVANEGLSDELQLTGTTGIARWVAGGLIQRVASRPPGILTFLLLPNLDPRVSNLANDERTRSRALFGQVVLDLTAITPGLRATAGARRSWDSVRRRGRGFAQAYNIFADATGPATCAEPASPAFGAAYDLRSCVGPAQRVATASTSWTGGLDYQLTDDVLVYAASRRGVRAGGLNGAISVPALQRFAPETLTDIEIGMKAKWRTGGARGSIAVAGFHDWMHDVQRQIFVTDPATGQLATVTANAARAAIDGIEVETELEAGPLVLSANAGWIDARYRRFAIPNLVGGAFGPPLDGRGNAFANTPRFTLGALGQVWLKRDRLRASTDVRHQSGFFFSDLPQAEPQGRAPAYTVLGARLDWFDALGRGLDAALYARNIGGKAYVLGGQALDRQLGITVANYGEPRIVGVELAYRWR